MNKVDELLKLMEQANALLEAFGDDDGDEDGLSKAEQQLANMGQKLSARQKRLLQKADTSDEKKGLKKVKKEDDEDEKPRQEGVEADGQALTESVNRFKQFAGI